MIERFFITLVRHGETMENREGVIQGQADTSLSELGRKQAALAGTRLEYERFTHAFSSDLSRAADTAQAIMDANQVSSCKLVRNKMLRERCFGNMEGKTFVELQDMLKERKLSFKSYTPEGGESIEQVGKRASTFFKEICEIVTSPTSVQQASNLDQVSCNSRLSVVSQGMEGRESDQRRTEEHGEEPEANGNIPNSFSPPPPPGSVKPLSIKTDNSMPSNSSATNSVVPSDSHFANQVVNGCQSDVSILVVSHGLWLKEFKKVLLNHYKGQPPDDITFLLNRVSPNTGVSKFAMRVFTDGRSGKASVKCEECCFLDCKSHLQSLDKGEVSGSKY